ncbi:hypothetical protein [Streptococcus loxodontisalivarius]|uniref:Uncharacterized protein n=1 Tax=Streptococcus loxodontisalivarius TaxID=1349415 RepID=A0ABS2PV70_9STRE|nr:hypothetical protein [Streptococcus loxodontisalivarius]MBM7643354.1 hypothetical protein [Streptococcus loxodontisalivarius]
MTHIREKEKLAKLIYLTVHPNYQLLYRSHLSLLAVIDLENTQSWQDLAHLISDFLLDIKKELD